MSLADWKAPPMPWRNPDAPNWPPIRNPFEVGAGVFYIALGFFSLIGLSSPSLDRVIPGAILAVFLFGAILSGLAIVAAAVLVHRDFPTSMLLERIGLKGIFGFSAYMLGVLGVAGRISPIALAFLIVYIVASLLRHWQVTKVVRWMKQVTERGIDTTELKDAIARQALEALDQPVDLRKKDQEGDEDRA